MKSWALIAALMAAAPSTATVWHKNIRMEGVFTDLGYLHYSSPKFIVEIIDIQGSGLEVINYNVKTAIGDLETEPNLNFGYDSLAGISIGLSGYGDEISSYASLFIYSFASFWTVYWDDNNQLNDAFVYYSSYATFSNNSGNSYLYPFPNGTYYDGVAEGAYRFDGFTVTATASLTNLTDHTVRTQPFYSISYNKLVISDVPEPGTWTLMLGGFGMIGGAVRYGRRSSAGRSGIRSAPILDRCFARCYELLS